MILYLTSNPTGLYMGGLPKLCPFSEENGFLARLKQDLPHPKKVLLVSSDPDDREGNAFSLDFFEQVFSLSDWGRPMLSMCDREHMNLVKEIDRYDLVILCGGHVPTENRFFMELELRAALEKYEGVIMGISAGTMNCAAMVYAQPDLPGESEDPSYKRWIPGLGLTPIQVIPHSDYEFQAMLDGKRLLEDITYPDSMGHTFYLLKDGSYIRQAGEAWEVYGSAWTIRDGILKAIVDRN